MLDKKLSELSGLTRTNLDGIDLVPVLDLNETVVNNRNKVLPIEELYQYIRRRFLAGGDLLYLLQGQNNTQNGYFNQISVNTINGNAFEGGNRVDFNGDVVVYVPGGIHASELVGISNSGSSIRILDTGAITVLQSLTESLRLTGDRRLLLGGANSRIIGNQYEELFQIESADPQASGISIVANNSSEGGASLILAKTRADVVGGITAVKNNDELGSILFTGANGTHLNSIGAQIQAAVDNPPFNDGENASLPTRLTFFTTSATDATPRERLCIDSTGLVSFNGDRSTGIYSSAPNTLDIKAGGVPAISATDTGVNLYGQINLFGFNPYITTLDSDVLTNNRTILFPDVSGTVIVSNSVGSVTGEMLASNTIVNDNINANADIQVSKLKHGLPGQFLQTNSTGTAVEWGLDFTVPGSLNVKGSSVFEGPFITQSNFQSAAFIPNGISVPVLGMYAPQGNQLGFSTNTVLQLLIDTNGQLKAGSAGTAALPTWTFNGDPNTGMYSPAADNLSFAVGGVEAVRINSSGALGLAGTDFGTPGQILFTNGPAALPSWRTLSGDVTINSSGVATISAGSIVDADINGAAAIADTKLATISSANKINIPAINLTGGTELGSSLQDTDLLLAHDDSSNARRSVLASRISDFVFSKVSGTLMINSAGVASLQPSIALAGVSTAPTAAIDSNSTQIANTAFVVGQAASSLPLMNDTAAVGTSLRYARADHVHGSDATKANLNSPVFTGVPTAPTAATDTNTTQIATTAYVVNQGYLKSTAASGLYAPINSPGLTGTPTGPTADTATNTTQLATTAFVKNVINSTFPGLVIKTACRLATTANITLSGEQAIDGINAVTNDRVLVKNQTTASENGAYIVSTGAWIRAADFDSNTEVVQGSYFYIENGTTNATTTWVLTTTGTIVVGTTALTFDKFSSADSSEAGSGLSKLGLTLNVGTASINRIVVNPDNIDLATTGVAAGTYQSVTVDAYGRVTSGTNPTTLAGFGITDAASANQTMYIGTTQIAINRASENLGLTGISSVVFPGSTSGNITLLAAATAGTNTLTLPAVTGTFITSADSGTVTNGMIAAGAISNSNVASNAALDFSKLAALSAGQILLGNNSNVVTATSVTGDITINSTGVTSIASGVIVDADINATAAIQDTKLATISTAGKVSNSATTATSNNTANTIVLRNTNGDFSAGVVTATGFIGNGSGLTDLPASQIVGALSSGALSNSTLHVGTTQVALNRASANQALTGISSVTFPGATSGTIVLQPAATAGTNTLTLPAATGTLLSSGDIGVVTNTMIAANTITNTNINNSAGITLSKLESVTAGRIILGNASNIPTATAISGDISITNTGIVSISSGVITNDDINSNAAISLSKLESVSAGRVVLGNISNVATATAISGDITINSAGIASIGTQVIVDSDISPFASIQDTKLATISSAGKVSNSATTATSVNSSNSIVSRDINGNFSAGVITAINFSGNGSGLTNLPASQLTGALSSNALSSSFLHVGTTSIALNRGSGNQALTGISSLTLPGASSGAITLQPAATAGNNTLTLPASTGTLLTSGDTGSVTGSVIASNTITNANINSNAAISFSKLESLSSGRVVLGNSSNVATATSISGDITLSSFGVASIALGVVSDVHINNNASISGAKLAVISQANKIALSALDIDGGQDIAAALTDADLFIVDDGGAGNNRKVNSSRISTYVFGKVSGEIGITSTGESIVNAGKIMNYHISTSAAINGAKVVPGFGSQDISTSGACLLSQGTSTQVIAGSVNGKYFGNSGNSYVLWSARSGTSGASHILFQNGNGNVGQISTSGSSTSFTTTSDYRLKENIAPIKNSSERVLQLKPCRFNFKADPTIRVDGFLAHEAGEVVPEAIVGEKDSVDSNGNPIYQGIDQSKLVPLLTAALQEALQSIKSLTARVEALEAG